VQDAVLSESVTTGAGVSVRETPTWEKWQEIPRVICHPPFLKKTISIAFVVGTILFAINHLDEVIGGKAMHAIWIKGALTYLVPFCVSNLGVLVAARRES
jgi:hypothetical protein